MFSIKRITDREVRSHRPYLCDLYYENVRVCALEDWAFACCGATSLHGLGGSYYKSFDWSHKQVDEFVQFAKDTPSSTGHKVREFYFLLTDTQVKEFSALVAHPNVRLVDRYFNKAHGPENLNLYRLSVLKDFSKIPNHSPVKEAIPV